MSTVTLRVGIRDRQAAVIDVDATRDAYRARDPDRACKCERCRNLAAQIEQTLAPPFRQLLEASGIDWRRPTEIELCSCRSNLALYLVSWDVILESEPEGGDSDLGTDWIAICRSEPPQREVPAASHRFSLALSNVPWVLPGPVPNDDE